MWPFRHNQSAFGKPENPESIAQAGMTCLLMFVFGCLFIFTRADAPADYDAVNYLLGLKEFNVELHQPHPPGAPLFIALGKGLVWLGLEPIFALTVMSTLGAVAFVGVWHRIFLYVVNPSFAFIGAMLLGLMPALWLSATQPMSDTFALALAAGMQWQIVLYSSDRRESRVWFVALLAAAAIGVRPQLGGYIVLALASSAVFVRLPLVTTGKAILLFAGGVCAWLVPTVVSQAVSTDGDWQAYFIQVANFGNEFSTASSSPVLANEFNIMHMGKRALIHVVSMGYFAAGLTLWYPDQVAQWLAGFGSRLTPIHPDYREWSLAGSALFVCYAIAVVIALPHVRAAVRSPVVRLLLLFAGCYVLTVLLLVPPHTRFYLPLLPLMVLVPVALLARLPKTVYAAGALCVLSVASLLSVVRDAQQRVPPPLALAHDVALVSAKSAGQVHALLDSNGRRHVEWLVPEVHQIRRSPETVEELSSWFENEGRLLVSSPDSLDNFADSVSVQLVGEYRAPLRVWMRHTGAQLYEVRLAAQASVPVESSSVTGATSDNLRVDPGSSDTLRAVFTPGN